MTSTKQYPTSLSESDRPVDSGASQSYTSPHTQGSHIYVYEIDPSVEESVLHATFAPISASIGSVITTVRVGRDTSRQKHLGYAFVNFLGPDDAQRVVQTVEPLFIHSSLVRMIPFQDRSKFVRPQRLPAPQSHPDGVFIKNIHPAASARDVYDAFAPFGRISGCRLAVNEYGQSRGFAYVTYEDEEDDDDDDDTETGSTDGETTNGSKSEASGDLEKSLKDLSINKTPEIKAETKDADLQSEKRSNGSGSNAKTVETIETIDAANNTTPNSTDQIDTDGKLNSDEGSESTSKASNADDVTNRHDKPLSDAKSAHDTTKKKNTPATRAIEKMSNTEFLGRRLFVGHNLPKRVRLNRFEEEPATTEFRNLFVRGIDLTVTEQIFYELFSNIGEMETYSMPLDEYYSHKGYGFVRYKDSSSAQKAIAELNGFELHGRTLQVTRAQQRSGPQNQHNTHSDSVTPQPLPSHVQQQQHHYHHVGSDDKAPANLYIRRFGLEVTDEMLAKEFEQFGAVVSSKVMLDEQGQSRGYGFVCFESPDDADRAIAEMNNKEIWGNTLYVAHALRKDKGGAGHAGHHGQKRNLRATPISGGSSVSDASTLGPRAPYYYVPIPYPAFYANGESAGINPYVAANIARLTPQQQGYAPTLAAAVASAENEAAEKQVIGEALYPKVLQHPIVAGNESLASQITGILLNQSQTDLLQWVDTDVLLNRRIQQAIAAYQDYESRRQ